MKGANSLAVFAAAAAVAASCILGRPLAAAVDVSSVENVKPALPIIPDRSFLLADFGAVGDGKTLNTAAFTKAVAAVDAAGGGKLVVPKGVFRTLPFKLCSSLDLHLDEGSVIQAPDSFAGYGLPDPSAFHSQGEVDAGVKAPDPLITGSDLHDVAITGPGTIDGNGALWWAWSERASRAHPGRLVYRRPHLVVIRGCLRLHVADITLTNSPMFHLVPADITDLTVERVKVRAPFDAPNTDAIDPGPVTNALVRDCVTDTGDDDICIKSGGANVLIENCSILHGHGISIGSSTVLGIHGMLVRNCTFEGSDNGIRIKSMRGAGGPVENVRYADIRMKDVANAFVLDLNYTDSNRPNFKGDPAKVPSIRNILFENISVENSRNAGRIVGLPESPITDIAFENVTISAGRDFVVKDAGRVTFHNGSRSFAR